MFAVGWLIGMLIRRVYGVHKWKQGLNPESVSDRLSNIRTMENAMCQIDSIVNTYKDETVFTDILKLWYNDKYGVNSNE